MITIVREEITTTSCVLQTFAQFVSDFSCPPWPDKWGKISLSMKHAYEFNNGLWVTSVRLITCSALAWLFSLFCTRHSYYFWHCCMNSAFIGLSFALIAFCQISLYREVRRQERQLSTQQVTEEARQKFLKDKRALKLTAIIVSLLFICYMPKCVYRVYALLKKFRSNISVQTAYACFYFVTCIEILNSFLNPVVYSIRDSFAKGLL